MADEFIKGLGIFTASGLAWMVSAAWYRTGSFESTQQLVEPITVSGPNLFNAIGIQLMEVFFWFALLGPLAFWVLIPAARRAKAAMDDRRAQ